MTVTQAALLAIPLAPLLAAILILLLPGRFSARSARGAGWLAVAGSGVSLLAALALWLTGAGTAEAVTVATVWAHSGDFLLTVGLHLDNLSLMMALLVAAVAFLVDLYAVGYMAEEADRHRFFATFAFFAGAMLALVLAGSFLLLFAAWEAVGLASFLLIGFHYREAAAREGAQKAFVLTRLGDGGLLLGWLLVLQQTGSTAMMPFLAAVAENGSFAAGTLTLLALLFFAGAAGKSAQIPLTAWLPAAMAGPTPVSALIHSATMVAAGVYLVLRLFPLFRAAPLALDVVLWVGALTALTAALVATAQYDLKRVLAWSTVSQLGEMMLALGLGGALAGAYHLLTHATFKATLFLGAGVVDHAAGSRDLRHLGRLAQALPLTTVGFVLAALALAGVPPFAGFWSEEAILAAAVARRPAVALLMLLLIFLAGVYIGRATTATFFATAPGSATAEKAVQTGETPLLLAPLLLLALSAALLGWLLSGRLEAWLSYAPEPHLALPWRLGAVLAGLAGLGLGAWRVRRAGAAPALGSWPRALNQGLLWATNAPARLAFAVAGGIGALEEGVDGLGRALGLGVLALARGEAQLETGVDGIARALGDSILVLARGEAQLETGVDAVARGLGWGTWFSARATDGVERRGFGATLDDAGGLFGRAGAGLRQLQSGKVYLYTLGLFLWVLALVVVGIVGWLVVRH